jgi:hypothetical protein
MICKIRFMYPSSFFGIWLTSLTGGEVVYFWNGRMASSEQEFAFDFPLRTGITSTWKLLLAGLIVLPTIVTFRKPAVDSF